MKFSDKTFCTTNYRTTSTRKRFQNSVTIGWLVVIWSILLTTSICILYAKFPILNSLKLKTLKVSSLKVTVEKNGIFDVKLLVIVYFLIVFIFYIRINSTNIDIICDTECSRWKKVLGDQSWNEPTLLVSDGLDAVNNVIFFILGVGLLRSIFCFVVLSKYIFTNIRTI